MRRIVQVGLSPALIIALDNVLLISVNIMLRRYGGADSDMLIACAAVMQSFMDKVSVRSAPGRGTRVTLTKHLEEKPST